MHYSNLLADGFGFSDIKVIADWLVVGLSTAAILGLWKYGREIRTAIRTVPVLAKKIDSNYVTTKEDLAAYREEVSTRLDKIDSDGEARDALLKDVQVSQAKQFGPNSNGLREVVNRIEAKVDVADSKIDTLTGRFDEHTTNTMHAVRRSRGTTSKPGTD